MRLGREEMPNPFCRESRYKGVVNALPSFMGMKSLQWPRTREIARFKYNVPSFRLGSPLSSLFLFHLRRSLFLALLATNASTDFPTNRVDASATPVACYRDPTCDRRAYFDRVEGKRYVRVNHGPCLSTNFLFFTKIY